MSENCTRNPNASCNVCQKLIYRRPRDLKRFEGRVFCSKACFGISCRDEHPCIVCSKPIVASKHKKTCSKECHKLNYLNPNRLHSKGKKSGGSKKTSNRSFRKIYFANREEKCQGCGYDKYPKILNIHHIIERHDGGSDDYSNLIALCPNCHTEIHKGFRKLKSNI